MIDLHDPSAYLLCGHLMWYRTGFCFKVFCKLQLLVDETDSLKNSLRMHDVHLETTFY